MSKKCRCPSEKKTKPCEKKTKPCEKKCCEKKCCEKKCCEKKCLACVDLSRPNFFGPSRQQFPVLRSYIMASVNGSFVPNFANNQGSGILSNGGNAQDGGYGVTGTLGSFLG